MKPEASIHPGAMSSRASVRWFWTVIMALAGASVFLFARHNAFPFTYHVDEERKVQQLEFGYRNCWHPLLLLTATDLGLSLSGVDRTPQKIAVAGRWCSAVFAGIAVAGFGLLAWLRGGRLAAVFAAIFVATHPQVYEVAHYMKEDAGLLMGIALSMLGIAWLRRSRSAGAASLLGAANGLALSGKYVGASVVLLSLPFLVAGGGRRGRLVSWIAYGAGLLIVTAAVNLPVLGELPVVHHGLQREWELMVRGHNGVSRSVPHLVYVAAFMNLISPPVILLAAFQLVRTHSSGRRDAFDLALCAFVAGYVILLSFFPKTADRYLLPVIAVTCYGAALGAADLARLAADRLRRIPDRLRLPLSATAVLLLGLSIQAPLLRQSDAEFAADHRADLARWIHRSLPKGTAVASGIWVQLPSVDGETIPHPALPVTDVSSYPEFAADHGTIEELRLRRIEYVAIAWPEYYAFLKPDYYPDAEGRAAFERRKTFYEELLAQGKLVWQSPVGRVNNLNPGIRLVRLPMAELAGSDPLRSAQP